MLMSVEFKDYTVQVIGAIDESIMQALEEVGGEIEAGVKRNTKVVTGQTKNSWQHKTARTDDGAETVIGSNYPNAIWEEFGTGEHALQGNGRKGGWTYKGADGQFYHTYGKPARRPFWNAYCTLKDAMISHVQSVIGKGLGG